MPKDASDRPKKSWREIDAGRENKKRRDSESDGALKPTSQAYRSYKTQLNKLFDGGAVPSALKDKLAPTAASSSAQQRSDLAAKIVSASTPKALKSALKAYTAEFGFPQNEDVLSKLLDAPDEATVLQTLEALRQLCAAALPKRAAAIKARLKTAQLTFDAPEIRDAAAELLKLLSAAH